MVMASGNSSTVKQSSDVYFSFLFCPFHLLFSCFYVAKYLVQLYVARSLCFSWTRDLTSKNRSRDHEQLRSLLIALDQSKFCPSLFNPLPPAFFSPQLAKQEKQQQRKEKPRSKGPLESGRERAAPRPRAQDPNASSGADGDVSSERET